MADEKQLQLLKANVADWNAWRMENPGVQIDLQSADLFQANLTGANLSNADLRRANLREANLTSSNLAGVQFYRCNMNKANLKDSNLSGANLYRVYLGRADLSRANFTGADLQLSILVETKIEGAILRNAKVHGISTWNLEGTPADQRDLIITSENESVVTVDNLKMAQFVYLLLANEEIRDVIDTITSKVVLILGRFTDDRKAVLDALRNELRERDLSPILFDFEIPQDRDITETVTLLARMARFIIADLTDPRCIPQEIQAIAPDVVVPIQPIILEGEEPWSMFLDLRRKYHWVLSEYKYKDYNHLIESMTDVLAIIEEKRKALSMF